MNEHPQAAERTLREGPGAASRTLAGFIFASRWLQAPLYLGLIIAQAVYVVLFFVELWHLIEKAFLAGQISETEVMLSVLALIDIVMIANLLIMVIIGGYETFVSKIRVAGHHDEPDWLSHVNANLLKVKLAVSIISISSIHLLKTFIEVGRMQDGLVYAGEKVIYSYDGVFWEVMIHLAFIVSALALAWIDRMGRGGHDAKHTGGRRAGTEPGPAAAAPAAAEPAAPVASTAPGAPAVPVVPVATTTGADGYITIRVPAGSIMPAGAERVAD